MNPTAIYSKSGKGVQEASGKTSHLDRGDRAVLSAIDGRATLADVAKKVGKSFDSPFQTLIAKLDKEGFIREASPGTAPAAGGAKPAAKPAARAASDDPGGDLDFSSLGVPKSAPAPSRPAPPPRPAAPPPRPAAPPPPPPPPKPNPAADAQAKAQQSALQKAREEAEARADAERQRVKAEAEAKMRAEMEAQARDAATQKLKQEAEARAKAEAEAKIRAAQEAAARAAAEAKAKADAEAKARVEAERKAREEAERARKAAEEEARKAREEAERARKAAEEEARKAREEAERVRKAAEEEARKAREEAERVRKAAEEERKREEAERAARRKREEEEEAERRRAREEEDRRHEEERAALRKQREEEEEREAQEAAAAKAKKKKKAEPAEEAPAPAKSEAASGLDSLMSDLDSFTTHEETERNEREEAERKAQEAAAQRAREEAERREKEEAERREKEEARARKQAEKQRKREEEEQLARKREEEEKRVREEEEKRKREMDERARKAKEEEVLTARATRGPATAIGEDTDEVRKRMIGRRGGAAAAPAPAYEPVRRKKSGLGKLVAIALVVVLALAVGAIHVMPVSTAQYERAASEAIGRPVKIGAASYSLLSGGLTIKMKNIRLGDDVRIASGTASPEMGSLSGEKKKFSRIELEGVQLPQEAIGRALVAKVLADNFAVERVIVKKLELTGAAVLPKPLEADLAYGVDGAVTHATIRGPDTLLGRITPKGGGVEFDVTASGFPLPILPDVTLSDFRMKGSADERGMQIAEWGGKLYGGGISGTANVRWSGGWSVDGVITARNINAAVFAPALLSQGKGEGTGRFSMNGAEPSKLAGRLEGNFTISSGVLGSFDLGRVIRTSGREFAGSTQFNELTGQATYDRGAVALRNIAIGAGALNAGASADISQSGALSGRIVADVKSSSGGRAVSATLHLGGTIKEPQVKN